MLKYKMTVPHVQLKISKMFCVLLMSLSFVCCSRFVLRYSGQNASYLGSCLCAYVLRRKNRQKKKRLNNLISPSNLKVKWRLLATHHAACQASQIQYRNVSLFSLFLLSRSLARLPTSPGDKSCMGTSLPHFRL